MNAREASPHYEGIEVLVRHCGRIVDHVNSFCVGRASNVVRYHRRYIGMEAPSQSGALWQYAARLRDRHIDRSACFWLGGHSPRIISTLLEIGGRRRKHCIKMSDGGSVVHEIQDGNACSRDSAHDSALIHTYYAWNNKRMCNAEIVFLHRSHISGKPEGVGTQVDRRRCEQERSLSETRQAAAME